MKIAVSSNGKTLDDKVDNRFGRAPYFIIVSPDEIEAIENPNTEAGGGVGVQTSQMLAEKKVDAVIAGNFGPKAYQVLAAAGIRVYRAEGQMVGEAIDNVRKGVLEPAENANKTFHW